MYDVYISFKNLDEYGKPTRDSVLARQVYDDLSGRGLRVFFSPVSLEKLGISAYKAAIDKALDSSRVLVAVGTSAKNLDSQWVRYEWDSFYNDILSSVKPDGRVFVYVEGCELNSLPRGLRQSQIFTRDDDGLERLSSFVANALPAARPAQSTVPAPSAMVAGQANVRPPPPAASRGGPHQFPYQKDLTERYGPEVAILSAHLSYGRLPDRH